MIKRNAVFDAFAKHVWWASGILGVLSLILAGGTEAVGGSIQEDARQAPAASVTAGDLVTAIAHNKASAALNSPEYIISPDDVLDVFVVDVQELSRAYRVSPTGSVTIPLLTQPIHAAGLSLEMFASLVESHLRTSGVITNPHVSVAAKESHVHSVSITGAVRNPKTFPVFDQTTLINVLAEAGGPSENAGGTIRVSRGDIGKVVLRGALQPAPAPTETQTLTIDLRHLLDGDPSVNVPVFPGDTVTVPLGGIVYVVGAVNKPGGFVLSADRQGMTVLQVLALAEDAKPTAIRDRALLVRRIPQADGARQEIPVKLDQIIAGKSDDVILQPNDILLVPDSSFKKGMRRGAEAAIQLATGVLIWGSVLESRVVVAVLKVLSWHETKNI